MSETLLRCENMSKAFATAQGELVVLRDVNFCVQAGQRVAVVGASGSGKTTLMHILGTLERPSSGRVFFADTDLFRLSPWQLDAFRNRHLGFVFQFHQLLPEFTAVENVMMPALIGGMCRSDALRQAEKLLDDVELGQRLQHKPGQLSGGEQQRVAIARALMMRPRLLIADEPTGNLDSVTSAGIYALLDRLHAQHDLTMVVVTHNDELAARMDCVYRISDGLIAVAG